MHFASALSTASDAPTAIREAARDIAAQMDGRPVDLALVFLSPHFAERGQAVADGLNEVLKPGVLIGCTAEGVIGTEHEVERQPALSLIAAHLPGVELAPFAFDNVDWRGLLGESEGFAGTFGVKEDARLVILLADPFSVPVEPLLDRF